MNRFNKLIQIRYRLYCGGTIARRIAIWMSYIIRWYYHCEIPYTINPHGIFFCHYGFGIVINPNTVIGEGTYIQHDVTIGSRDDIGQREAPVIGKNCYIGAKAIIIGNIKIGDNVKIGAGAVVISDIPSNSTAVGVPAKVIVR